jgi:hypothetical protein
MLTITIIMIIIIIIIIIIITTTKSVPHLTRLADRMSPITSSRVLTWSSFCRPRICSSTTMISTWVCRRQRSSQGLKDTIPEAPQQVRKLPVMKRHGP